MIVLMNDARVVKLYQVLAVDCPCWVWRWQEQSCVQYQIRGIYLVTIVIEQYCNLALNQIFLLCKLHF